VDGYNKALGRPRPIVLIGGAAGQKNDPVGVRNKSKISTLRVYFMSDGSTQHYAQEVFGMFVAGCKYRRKLALL
jgi:hypothetical protein